MNCHATFNTYKWRKRALTGLAATVLATSALQAKELVYSSYLPPSHLMNTLALPNFISAVEEASDTDLKIKLVAGAQLFDAKASMTATGEGLADITNGLSPYAPNELPHFNILFEMAGFVDDPLVGTAAALQTVLLDCEECREDFTKLGVTFLGSYGTSSSGLMCTKDVSTLSDLEGLKVRVSGSMGRLAEALGATPVRVGTADLVSSMERGNIDCILGALSWMTSYNLYDTVESVIAYPFGAFPNAISVAFNTDVWESLDESDRSAALKALPSLTADLTISSYIDGHYEALEKAKESGINVTEGDGTFAPALAEYQKNDEAAIVETAVGFGVENAQEIIDTFKSNLKRWDDLLGKNADREKFEELIWTEIFSKL